MFYSLTMALLLESCIAELIVAVSAAIVVLYLWFDRGYKYWKDRGVPYVPPTFPFGNYWSIILSQKSVGPGVQDMYNMFPGERFVGHYGFRRPILLIRDPELIRQILVKDFATFHDRGLYFDEEEPLNRQLFFLSGYRWRQLRIKLSPTFTSGKLKGMFKTLQDCGREMAEVLEDVSDRGETVEVRELAARYTTDVVASVAFGIECHCQRNPDAEFRQWGRKVFQTSPRMGVSNLLTFACPALAKFLKVKAGTSDISEYFQRMVSETIAYRQKNNVTRKDFMDLLIQLKTRGFVDSDKADNGEKEAVVENKMTAEEVAAQAFVFFAAGFETSSTTMSFALHEVALNPRVQERIHQEIDSVLKEHDGDISYDAITQMSYLDKVMSETLRKYPALPILNRECNQEYRIPDSDVVLEKGTPVAISVLGLQRDPKYFPDPERFDPERFSEEQKAKRHPYVYLPFGEGPRICIGMRLGLLQAKVGLAYILSKYKVLATEKTKAHLDFNSKSLILLSESGIQLQLQKRS